MRPSRRAVVTESATVITTPVHVTIHAEIAAVTTNTDTGTVRSSTRLDAAARPLTTAHRIVSRLNSRRMPGRTRTSGLRGQKSLANRAINGRPNATDPANIRPV